MGRNLLPASSSLKETPTALSPISTQWQPIKPKKKLNGGACEYCRKRRRRCNGDRPCTNCQANHQECIFEIQETETPSQALKRKYAQVQQDRDDLQELFSMISNASPRKSAEIFDSIRSGQGFNSILKQMQRGDMVLQATLDSERHARRIFLSNLMQTTASFDDLVDFMTNSIIVSPETQMPSAAQFRQLRGQQVELDRLLSIAGFSSPQRRIAISDLLSESGQATSHPEKHEDVEVPLNVPGASLRKPPFKVPAKPWTTLADDDLVSHLVSSFLEWVNPFWRCVEEDLFITAMKAGDPNSDYCSPFLVHSILALASLNSEREGVFVQTDEYMTRGQHFHDEALRLWRLEEGTISLPNLCGLCALFLDCVLRGKDKLGVNVMALLAQENRDVPRVLKRPDATPSEAATYARARQCASWSAVICDIATANTCLKPAFQTCFPEDTLLLSDLPELAPAWAAYPTQHAATPLDKNVLFLENCKLTQLCWKVQHLLYASNRNDPDFPERAESLARSMVDWKRSLPESLRYRESLPGPVFDLYACYNSVLMALYSLFETLIDDRHPYAVNQSPILEPQAATKTYPDPHKNPMHEHALACAQDMAAILRGFRSTYGLKIATPYLVQAMGVACYTLLPDLSTPASQTAFKEAFRCLLGAGMQLLWARGMARMLHLTAQNTGIQLPKAVKTLLDAVKETAWTKTDTEMLSSCWPNYVIAKGAGRDESVLMEDLIKKWERLGVNEEGSERG